MIESLMFQSLPLAFMLPLMFHQLLLLRKHAFSKPQTIYNPYLGWYFSCPRVSIIMCYVSVYHCFKLVYLLLFRTLPRAIIIGLPLIILVYILINISFFVTLSIDEIMNSESEAIAIVSVVL